MKRILVTGGLGFVGSHLVEFLIERGEAAYILVVDNMQSNAVSPEFFTDRYGPGKVTVWQQPINRLLLADNRGFNEVYHLASVVGPVGVLQHKGHIVEKVMGDTYFIAELVEKWGAKLVDVSTSEVYGGGQHGLCSEDMPKIVTSKTSARLEYAIAKLAAETALINMGSNCVIIRPFNIAGPRQKPDGGFVLPRFIRAAKKNERLTVYGDGMQVRAFTHVRDIVKGMWLAMQMGVAGSVYNIGNPENRVNILTLATRVIKLLKSESAIAFVDPKELWGPDFEEAADKYPDASRAQAELGWHPEYNLDMIIEEAAA